MDSHDEKLDGITKGFLKFGLKSLAIAGETVKPFLPLFGEALSIVDEIVAIYDDAQYNRKSCITLIDRVENAKTAVKALSRRKEENEENFRNEDYYLSFTKFIDTLKRIKSFVKEVSSLSKFRNFIQSKEIREKFQILIEDFDSVVSNIEGGVTDAVTGINTVLEEVEILSKKIDKLTPSSIVGEEFVPTEIPPIELEEPKQKFTDDNYCKKWSRKLLNNVFCKKIITANENTLEYKKINAQLAILGRMQQSSNIIKFYGLSTVNSERVMIFEWAGYGNLKEFYEKFEIDWPLKLQIAVNICRGIAFLHACFGMLLWELAFQRIPYKKYNQQQIMEYVVIGGREKLDFGLNLTSVQQEFGNVIKAAWQGDPLDRPEIKILFNTLDELSQANKIKDYSAALNLREIQEKNEDSCDLDDDLMPEMPNYTIDILPYEPLLPLKGGCEAHKNKDFQKAWKCFVGHANNGNSHAKYWQGYYLLEGINGKIDKEKGITLLRESADEGIKEAQCRYAFILKDKEPFDKNEFVKYLTLAADNGLDSARYNLGDLYINGKLDIDKDIEKGLRYLRLAAYNKHQGAIEMLNTLRIN
ncbi:hypothetical protein RclHR1_12930005 [Rhizophagus clarus]|uniref:Tyrosine-protein kinase catalytic domain-containing protein n=1 Tax=Rhizophagus clarus TaxID=94130 RepID=A0A2Z6R0Y9_9GLOM|nr:hypothetical protein RclHR1_12930005 [Rhizophagus clarus]